MPVGVLGGRRKAASMRLAKASWFSRKSKSAPTGKRVTRPPATTTRGTSTTNKGPKVSRSFCWSMELRLLDPHAAAEALLVGMVEQQAGLGIAPAVVAGPVVEVHEPQALHLEASLHHGLGPTPHHVVETGLGVLIGLVLGQLLHHAVGLFGEASHLREEGRRFLVRADRLLR